MLAWAVVVINALLRPYNYWIFQSRSRSFRVVFQIKKGVRRPRSCVLHSNRNYVGGQVTYKRARIRVHPLQLAEVRALYRSKVDVFVTPNQMLIFHLEVPAPRAKFLIKING